MSEFIGKIKWVSEVEQCTGKIKEKVTVVISDKTRDIAFLIFDTQIYKLLEPLEIGDKVKVEFSVKSREYKGKWYTEAYALTIEKVERQKRQQRYQKSHYRQPPPPTTNWFSGCKSREEIKKRYKDLCKEHHPDRPTGNLKKMQDINQQYDKIK